VIKPMVRKIPKEGIAPSHLTIFVGSERRKVIIPIKREGIVIGRSSIKRKVDFDTNPFGGLEKGVSREHLLISSKRDYLLVKDLETANSTWHNKVRMRPMVAEELYHGDVLHLGELRLEILFTYPEELKALQQGQLMLELPKTQPITMPDNLAGTKPDTHQLNTPTQQSGATRLFEDD
jgi:pSer/pThr/pTyr-binding forkhead associated (FHA) protein